jgi:hypothetical protein
MQNLWVWVQGAGRGLGEEVEDTDKVQITKDTREMFSLGNDSCSSPNLSSFQSVSYSLKAPEGEWELIT